VSAEERLAQLCGHDLVARIYHAELKALSYSADTLAIIRPYLVHNVAAWILVECRKRGHEWVPLGPVATAVAKVWYKRLYDGNLDAAKKAVTGVLRRMALRGELDLRHDSTVMARALPPAEALAEITRQLYVDEAEEP